MILFLVCQDLRVLFRGRAFDGGCVVVTVCLFCLRGTWRGSSLLPNLENKERNEVSPSPLCKPRQCWKLSQIFSTLFEKWGSCILQILQLVLMNICTWIVKFKRPFDSMCLLVWCLIEITSVHVWVNQLFKWAVSWRFFLCYAGDCFVTPKLEWLSLWLEIWQRKNNLQTRKLEHTSQQRPVSVMSHQKLSLR